MLKLFSRVIPRSIGVKTATAVTVLAGAAFVWSAVSTAKSERILLEQSAAANYAVVVDLLAAQLSGAFRWGKPAQIESAYATLSEGDDSSVVALHGIKKSGERFITKEADAVAGNPDLAAALEGLALDAEPSVQVVGDLMVAMTPVLDAKSGNPVGAMAVTWSQAALNATLAAEMRNQILWGLAKTLVVAAIVFLMLRQWVSRPLTRACATASLVASGDLDTPISTRGRDEVADLMRELADMQAQLRKRRSDDAVKATEMQSLTNALDSASSSILVLTADSDIQFVNQAAQQLLTNYQQAIGFSGDLIGQSLPAMMPSIQGLESALTELHQPRSFRFSLPGFQGQLTATPVMTVDGERSGCVVEWQDNTEQLAIEQEIASLVSAAQQGDLSVRAKTAGRDGFLLGLSEGFNALLETWDDVLVDVNSALGQVAEGDLTPRLSQNYDGAYARLAANLNQALEKMGATLTQIDELADSISSGVRQINSGNQDLSQRTEQQANELQHIMQSLSEFSASMHTNAESTHASSNEAQATVSQASESQQTLSDAIAAMEQINQASSQISQIIGVIDEIAFQTNLLALNASVEAARAGESGRGFAVVATEVRNLAQRSATAASDIKSLILDSEQKVQAGTALVNHSGEALAAMVDRIGHLSEVSQALRTSIDTQLGALDKVQNGTQSIDNSTQQNASLAEQTSAASELLEARAKELFDSVRLFKVS